jgi:hypothetical protein
MVIIIIIIIVYVEPFRIFLHEKLTSQVVKKFPKMHGTRILISVFVSGRVVVVAIVMVVLVVV